MAYDDDSAEAEIGKRAEQMLKRRFLKEGKCVWHSNADGDSAPMVEIPGGRLIKLDLGITGAGVQSWEEVKWKHGPVLLQKLHAWRHGIDKHKWEHYKRVIAETGIPGFLNIISLSDARASDANSPRWLRASFEYLSARLVHTEMAFGPPSDAFPTGSVNWDIDAFEDMGPFDLGGGAIPETERNLHPWEKPSRLGHVPSPKDWKQSSFGFIRSKETDSGGWMKRDISTRPEARGAEEEDAI